jgi:hypothetical protein
MQSAVVRWVGPAVLFLIGLGVQLSGFQSPELAVVFIAVGLAWLLAVYVWTPLRKNLRVSWNARVETSAAVTTTPAPRDPFSGAPMLRFVDPFGDVMHERRFSLYVWCENSGPLESVAVVMFREAAEDQTESAGQWIPWVFESFPVHSMIHSVTGDSNRRFLLTMRSSYAWSGTGRDHGVKTIKWTILYKDNQMVNGYMTTATVQADFRIGGEVVILQKSLDATSSPAERNRRYEQWVARKGDPST